MAFSLAIPWNSGEEKMHQLMQIPSIENPTSSMLTPQAAFMFQRAPLLAIGTLDSKSRPWTTIWGGLPGFSQPLGSGIVGTRTLVDGVNDPVVQALVGGSPKGDVVQGDSGMGGAPRMVSGLAIDLMSRKRVKVFGRMVAGSLGEVEVEGMESASDGSTKQDQLQIVNKIEQSLGNCPKYLNQYEIKPARVRSELVFQSPKLSPAGRALVDKADMFFLSSCTTEDMDTNHRGGPPGFVRVLSNDASGAELVYPEYSGNRLYQSLGNLQVNPKVGVVFPDYETGDVLYLTGASEILIGDEAGSLLPGSNLAVKIRVQEARYVKEGLPFRGTKKSPSPYNPPVRVLSSEGNLKSMITSTTSRTATLVQRDDLTPNIARFEFMVQDGLQYAPGQWIALDFSQDLDYGYSHMRDEDPQSLNDDFVRTFTISSAPKKEREQSFEITIRQVGPVTRHLFKQHKKRLEEVNVPILGVGGDFKIEQAREGTVTPYIAGGVGITPLLGQIHHLQISPDRFKLFWALRAEDAQFAFDTFQRYPDLRACTTVFLTGLSSVSSQVSGGVLREFIDGNVRAELRRIEKRDLDNIEAAAWYLCAGKELKRQLLNWLEGKSVIFEDFNY